MHHVWAASIGLLLQHALHGASNRPTPEFVQPTSCFLHGGVPAVCSRAHAPAALASLRFTRALVQAAHPPAAGSELQFLS